MKGSQVIEQNAECSFLSGIYLKHCRWEIKSKKELVTRVI